MLSTRLCALPRGARILRLPLRPFSTSRARLNATPDWEELIGGRAGIERKRAAFVDKYREALETKARAEGITVEQLKERAALQAKAKEAARTAELQEPRVVRPAPSSEPAQKQPLERKSSDSPIKPLNDIMDLSKAVDLTTSALSQLWTTYHQTKGFLSAAVPLETYLRMLNSARKYPLFVLPLTKVAELPEGQESATEMHLLEWSVLPQPPSTTEPVPPPSTVLFTPLAEYKARQEYAQPYLILTHYTDLAASHNVILMRGEITPNVALNSTDAQVLAVRMQLFYNDSGKDGSIERQRRELLRSFHETPDQFDVEKLIKAGELTEVQ
ncbi:ATP11 protein-domain-containing protein [Rhodotorula diobovata]|uniref:ATP11 protein-domain-containing protein n=1 Tax=Rhodotorula diobovata TaxID=5288 RepID=A0A5C5FQM4_9BASI|nr:ATP11 protein-domain-containing protein [Rhodotorula diobovata]